MSQIPEETFGAQDMSGLRRYEVALEAEEEIYWGCFYFFPWLRMWRRDRSSAHPREQKLEPLRGLMSCWHFWDRTRQKQEALLLSPSITCCTQLYRQPLSNKLLRKVIRVELQEADGDCHLQAFVLHLSRRSVCIHPQNRSLARWFERQGRRFQGILPNLN
ncbi:chemokine (c-c motif) ligand 27 [Lynx pardinus]|uniref:Chemokine (C-c motif) ligand 27 n=1 Tax=Lynx pardinus TaxID=191816 RepID=A0A485MQT4_LYNPA|nr:chemokine (c-c motif) ligand 27 [Lynx pardinus]